VSAVIFDCDGVLVDSEPISEAAWARSLASYGYEVGDGEFAECLGRSRRDIHAYFAGRHPLPGFAQFSATLDREILPGLERDLAAFPDAVEAVRELALNGVPLAVASSSQRRDLDLKLRVTGLGRYFDFSVAGDEVAAGKPAPDLFFAAAGALGVGAEHCLVVEDSLPGATAARAAGMRVVTVDRTGDVLGALASVDRLDAGLLMTWLGVR
jgi:HAD superfamily hydrolase (TIGR01509 family)